MSASASGSCSCICLIRLAARRDGRYQAIAATRKMAMTEPMGERLTTPTTTASINAIAALMTMYSPDRNGMAARSRRRSRAPLVSMRPKMPGDADRERRQLTVLGGLGHHLDGHLGRAHGVVEDLGQRALLRAHPHDGGHDGQGQPGPDEDGRHERPGLAAQLQCSRASGRSPPAVAAARQHLVHLLRRWLHDPPGPRRAVVAAGARPTRAAERVRRRCGRCAAAPRRRSSASSSRILGRRPVGTRRPIPSDVSTRWKMSWSRTVSPSMPWISVMECTTRGPAGGPLQLDQDSRRP